MGVAVKLLFLLLGLAHAQLSQRNCDALKSKLTQRGLPIRYLSVPLDYTSEGSAKIQVAYWIRPGKDPGFPPLLLLHGGPGGSSLRFLDWTLVFENYPGDLVSLDQRGESCSSAVAPGLPIESYANYRARVIVRDLEKLRRELYKSRRQWRVFGQSRGSVVAHYYLDMFPDSVESLNVHGYSMGSPQFMENYSQTRTFFSARASLRFVAQYPKAGYALELLKAWLDDRRECFQFFVHEDASSRHELCGAIAVDALSFDLGTYTAWPGFAAKLESLVPEGVVDESAARAYFQGKISANSYVTIFNYIAGTNAQDMGHPNPEILRHIVDDPFIRSAPICEGRFIAGVMLPWYRSSMGADYVSHVDPIHHDQILEYLEAHPSFRLNLFASDNDPYAGPEAYDEERAAFGLRARFHLLTGSAHDGWLTDPMVAGELLSP